MLTTLSINVASFTYSIVITLFYKLMFLSDKKIANINSKFYKKKIRNQSF